jgi:DNA-binding NarL/FixJ family response regulator
MSKHRPSNDMRHRVFRNSFTRGGVKHAVKGWAFKVQVQGRRRTFSLVGRTRAEAAREARQIYEVLRGQGWDAAMRWYAERRRSETVLAGFSPHAPKATPDVSQWEERLIRRRYHEARVVCGPELSVRIEHDGAYGFFPLGSEEPKAAAQRAQEIYQAVVSSGWEAASARYSREITMAITWSENPLAVTYTALYTFVGGAPPERSVETGLAGMRKRIALLEPDPSVRSCVRFWLDRQPGFSCPVAVGNAAALEAAPDDGLSLVLLNRASPEYGQVNRQIRERNPAMPVFGYRLHEESDQIFISISGVSGGYILRRRLPEALFDPLQPVVRGRPLTAAEAERQVRNYFQSFFGSPPPTEEPSKAEGLTQREQEIFHHMSKGYLDKEIAHNLNLSIWTVHNHVKHIYEKLKVHNRTEAVLRYLQK